MNPMNAKNQSLLLTKSCCFIKYIKITEFQTNMTKTPIDKIMLLHKIYQNY